MGTSRLKITPTFPQPKKSPLKLWGFFPLPSSPSSLWRRCILNSEGRNFKSGGIEQRRRMGSERGQSWRIKREKQGEANGCCCSSSICHHQLPIITSFNFFSPCQLLERADQTNENYNVKTHHLDMNVIQLDPNYVNQFIFSTLKIFIGLLHNNFVRLSYRRVYTDRTFFSFQTNSQNDYITAPKIPSVCYI